MDKLPKFAIALEYAGEQAPQVTARNMTKSPTRFCAWRRKPAMPIHLRTRISRWCSIKSSSAIKYREPVHGNRRDSDLRLSLSGKHKAFMDDIEAAAAEKSSSGTEIVVKP